MALWLQIDWKGFWVDMLKADILRSAVGLADILRMISLSFFVFFLNISVQEHFPAGREKKKTQHYSLENLFIK